MERIKLSIAALAHLQITGFTKPIEIVFHYPVKIIQFGTRVLLRGLIVCLIDNANNNGFFQGRISVLKLKHV